MIHEQFSRYIWLLNLLQRTPSGLSLNEIRQAWARHTGEHDSRYPRSTFNDHIRDIESIFDVTIICDKSDGYRYRLEDPLSIKAHTKWLIDSLAVSSFLRKYDSIRKRVLIEDIPSSQTYLIPILEAIRDGKRIELTYTKFTDNTPKTITLEAYLVKATWQRWYVYGHHIETGEMQTYALDRISSLRQLEQTYSIPEDFDASEVFLYSFGIMEDTTIKPQTIRIKVDSIQARYFDTLPLHHSQRVVEKALTHTIYEYFLRPTGDLFRQLLSYGASVKVIFPAELAQRLRAAHREAAENEE